MTDRPSTPGEMLLIESMGETARRERRLLMAVSAALIVAVNVGLVPQRLSMLGVDFTAGDQRILLRASGVLILYILLVFLVYAISDLLLWQGAFSRVRRKFDADVRAALLDLLGTPDPPDSPTPAPLQLSVSLKRALARGDRKAAERELRRTLFWSHFRRFFKSRDSFVWVFGTLRISIDYVLPVGLAAWAFYLAMTAEPPLPPIRGFPLISAPDVTATRPIP